MEDHLHQPSSSNKKKRLKLTNEQTPTIEDPRHQNQNLLQHFGPPNALPLPIGSISPDAMGKMTAQLLFSKLNQFDPTLKSEMYWKQNRTGADGNFSCNNQKFEIEVKWSSIQLQDRKNTGTGPKAHYRWEFGNVNSDKFEVLICFGYHGLQITATAENLRECKADYVGSDENVVWNQTNTSSDEWLLGCSVFILSKSTIKESERKKNSRISSLHFSVSSPRGPYKTVSGVRMGEYRSWCGDLQSVWKKFQDVIL